MPVLSYLFFFNDTATTEIYTLSLHDALPISSSTSVPRGSSRRWSDQGSHERVVPRRPSRTRDTSVVAARAGGGRRRDRKSTRLNSSHLVISYAVFCLKKKNAPHSSAS